MSFVKEGVLMVETVKQPIEELKNHQDATTTHHFCFFPPPLPTIYNRSAETTTSCCREREHMFEKVVTPSDVGKLNRLVIPKQHAEKYFPLDSSLPEKGLQSLLLNFEDSSGKPWRFRYSYWSSSQSYVITKGWSRFVKEKKLNAGDIVSFDREIGDCVRFFINWRRRTNMGAVQLRPVPWGRVFFPPTSYTKFNYSCNYNVFNPASLRYDPFGRAIAGGGEGGRSGVVFESVPVVPGRTVGKQVRLFGVNLDCPSEEEGEGCSSSTIVPAMEHDKPLPSTSVQLISRDLQRRSKLSLSLDLDI